MPKKLNSRSKNAVAVKQELNQIKKFIATNKNEYDMNEMACIREQLYGFRGNCKDANELKKVLECYVLVRSIEETISQQSLETIEVDGSPKLDFIID